jgi:mycothiol system anti-sigma-R factor
MSCGNHHDLSCDKVLIQLYQFIDNELDDASCAEIQHHLDECAPCLRHHELDLLVQRLVARSCTAQAPQPLRDRVLLGLRQVVQVEVNESGTTTTTSTSTTVSW